MKQAELVFVPLGGVGEIGMNLALYGYGPKHDRDWIMVDLGVTFPGPDLPGVNLVLPDIRFAIELGDRLKAIIITHAHEDHYGAILALWPLLGKPIYCTPFTSGMLEAKAVYEKEAPKLPINHYSAGQAFTVGPFEIEPVWVTHSIPEPVSLAIKTPLGCIIHTGDWKIDAEPSLGAPTDEKAFTRLGDEGVLALMCDSTNAMREGSSPTEASVSESLAELIKQSPGRVAITTFSSNVGRIRSIARAAAKAGRKCMLMGSSIRRVVDVATDLGYFDDMPDFIEEDEFASTDRREIVIILTGSQGESRAALAKISREEHRNVHLAAGDRVVFSSRTIPGNEKPIIEIQNRLIEMGIDIITDDDTLVHVSGHPRRIELKKMYDWTRPEILIPVHGEAAHLMAQAKLGGEHGIPSVVPTRNGDMVRLAPGNPEIIDNVPFGRIFMDGYVIDEEGAIGVVERRRLSFAGHVAVSIVLDRKGHLADDIDVSLQGLPDQTASGDDFENVLYETAIGTIKSIPPAKRKNEEMVREAVRRAIRATARDNWGKRPVTTVFVAKVKE